jgi:hypothetical protein
VEKQQYFRNDSVFPIAADASINKNEREQLIFEIIVPLLQTLTRCYDILDRVEDQPSPATAEQDNHSPKNARKKPPPPRGMLSIQHYTDVACLLEVLVCLGVMPHLEAGSLLSLADRVRYQLPKSLAGRMPRAALLWGSKEINQPSAVTVAKQLLAIATTIANLTLLERFRPMLLPRHLTDIYAAIFQAERLLGKIDNMVDEQLTRNVYMALGLLTEVTAAETLPTSNLPPVDATLQAKAYQTLLLQGTQSPRWLRQRVSPLLTQLAGRNLAAIVTVFVPASTNNDRTRFSASSQRLGQALVASAPDTVTMQRLCQQMMELLTVAFPVTDNSDTETNIHPRSMAVIQTAWAMLDHLPASVVKSDILEKWKEDLSPQGHGDEGKIDVHIAIRQIGALCAYVTPHSTTSPIQKFLFQLLDPSIMGQILRVACLTHNKIVFSTLQSDAQRSLQWLTHAVGTTDSVALMAGEHDQVVSPWVSAIEPSSWDVQGNTFAQTSFGDDNQTFGKVVVKQQQIDLPKIVTDTTQRADFFVDKILLVLAPTLASEEASTEDLANDNVDSTHNSVKALPSKVFRYLLRAFLSGPRASGSTQLVCSMLVPALVEKCSQEQLLFCCRQNAIGLLELIEEVLLEVISQKGEIFQVSENKRLTGLPSADDSSALDPLASFVDFSSEARDETLFAVASILLSLLIAILEVGSKQRSAEEEEKFQTFIPILTRLSEPASNSSLPKEEAAAMADMSSYAMALIVSRKSNEGNDKPSNHSQKDFATLTAEDKLQKMLSDAEDDLRSTQPPLRARGMVILGRLARGFSGALVKNQARPKIEELGVVETSSCGDKAVFVKDVFRLAIVALSDLESYVYLAAIQTVVALSDLDPRTVLPMLASSVVSGKITFHDENGDKSSCIELSKEQRIKLFDALMFAIRRRAVTDEYVPMLVNVMLGLGTTNELIADQIEKTSPENQLLMQVKTTNYFLGKDKQNEEEMTKQEAREDQDIRVRTGGPVFDAEETDAIRAARISVFAELLNVTTPDVMARYCSVFSRVAMETLRLDTSRLVTRAAALLAREIYFCVQREADKLVLCLESEEGNETNCGIQFALALVSTNETLLHTALLQYITGNTGTPVDRIFDPTTLVRCEEAKQFRDELERQGIFVAATIIAEDEHALEKLPSVLRISASRKANNSFKINPRESLE